MTGLEACLTKESVVPRLAGKRSFATQTFVVLLVYSGICARLGSISPWRSRQEDGPAFPPKGRGSRCHAEMLLEAGGVIFSLFWSVREADDIPYHQIREPIPYLYLLYMFVCVSTRLCIFQLGGYLFSGLIFPLVWVLFFFFSCLLLGFSSPEGGVCGSVAFWLRWLFRFSGFWLPAPPVFLAAFEPCSGPLETVTPHSANG